MFFSKVELAEGEVDPLDAFMAGLGYVFKLLDWKIDITFASWRPDAAKFLGARFLLMSREGNCINTFIQIIVFVEV